VFSIVNTVEAKSLFFTFELKTTRVGMFQASQEFSLFNKTKEYKSYKLAKAKALRTFDCSYKFVGI